MLPQDTSRVLELEKKVASLERHANIINTAVKHIEEAISIQNQSISELVTIIRKEMFK